MNKKKLCKHRQIQAVLTIHVGINTSAPQDGSKNTFSEKSIFYAAPLPTRKASMLFFLTDFSLYLRIVPLYVLTGKAKTKEARQTIINPDWNFEKMGIGGLDKEFSDIFRRAFASRVFPPDIVEQMGEEPFSHLY